MLTVLLVIGYLATAFVCYGVTYGALTHEFYEQRSHFLASILFGLLIVPGIVSSIMYSCFVGGVYWRIKPLTRAERWASYKQKFSCLAEKSNGYEHFLKY